MTINLHDITGQESGIILVETDDGRHMNVVANWGAKDGLPYLFEPMLEPFSFVFLQPEDVHVETERIHSGALNDEIAHDGLEDWNPLDDDLDYHNELWANGGCNNQFFPAETLGQYRDAKQWFSAKTLSMTAELNGWDKIPAQSSETLQDAFDRIANLREEVWELKQICHRTDAEQLLRRAAEYLEEAQDAVEVTLSARKEYEGD